MMPLASTPEAVRYVQHTLASVVVLRAQDHLQTCFTSWLADAAAMPVAMCRVCQCFGQVKLA